MENTIEHAKFLLARSKEKNSIRDERKALHIFMAINTPEAYQYTVSILAMQKARPQKLRKPRTRKAPANDGVLSPFMSDVLKIQGLFKKRS